MIVTECPLAVMGHVGPFSDELIVGSDESLQAAHDRLATMEPLDAVRLVLTASRRSDAVIGDAELDLLAESLGCFQDDEDDHACKIRFEATGDLIACEMDGNVFLRCPSDKTDLGMQESLDGFIVRHGGIEATVQYLRIRQNA